MISSILGMAKRALGIMELKGISQDTLRNLPKLPRDNLSKVIIGMCIAMTLLTVIGVLVFGGPGFGETIALIPLPWVQPTSQSLIVLSSIAIAILFLGRGITLDSSWVFWSGLLFLAQGVLSIFYLLSWPGLLGERGLIVTHSNTPSWFFMLIFSIVALQIIAVNARWPDRLKPSYVYVGYGAAVVLPIIIGLLSLRFEDLLPVMIVGMRFTAASMAWSVILIGMAALAAVSAYGRYRAGEDKMLGYMSLFLLMVAFGLLHNVLGGRRYDLWWYIGRISLVTDYLVILFGFLQEGYALFAAEKMQAVALAERSRQLEAANKELDSFNYTIAHDLRNPLRVISTFSQILLKGHEDTFDADTKRKLHGIRDNTQRMSQLLDDLLTFSQLNKTKLSLSVIDMEELVKEVWNEQLTINAVRERELRNCNLPMASGDRALIRQVLSNLLSNAIKFTGVKEGAIIEIGGKIDGQENEYWVKDNGCGFNMDHYGKLFRVFHRLHGIEEFEGTGVGLAIVQRIIQRHGGRVWAEGKENKGATFYFTLPGQ